MFSIRRWDMSRSVDSIVLRSVWSSSGGAREEPSPVSGRGAEAAPIRAAKALNLEPTESRSLASSEGSMGLGGVMPVRVSLWLSHAALASDIILWFGAAN
jgi:hypothetical protein